MVLMVLWGGTLPSSTSSAHGTLDRVHATGSAYSTSGARIGCLTYSTYDAVG